MGLRSRVALLVAISCALVAIAVGSIGYRSTERRLVDEVDRSLDQTLQLVIGRNGGGRVQTRVPGDVYSIRVLAADGAVARSNFEVVLPVGDTEAQQVIGRPLARTFESRSAVDGERVRVLTIGLEGGAVQIVRPLDETDNVLRDLRMRTLVLVLLVALAGAAIGAIASGRIAAPLRRLTSAAESVEASGRLDVDLGPEPDDGRLPRDEVGRLRGAFGSMLVALQRSQAAQERLVQDAGHELRTPLTSLRTNLAVLRRHEHMPDEMREEIVAELDAEIDELTDLVNELVDAAQGRPADEAPERVEIADVARTVAARVGRRRSRRIDVHGDGGRSMVPPSALARAVTNLVDNACKFDTSGAPIEVRVSTIEAADGKRVALRVLDRGPGVPDADLARIFDRFHRVEATRAMPGSGLGLSIVRDVVVAAGGRTVAANRPEGGAEIGFDLPAIG
ncbi:MAG: HAMP domain-containing sensor histidine kinase [Actinomycetota bacterium]